MACPAGRARPARDGHRSLQPLRGAGAGHASRRRAGERQDFPGIAGVPRGEGSGERGLQQPRDDRCESAVEPAVPAPRCEEDPQHAQHDRARVERVMRSPRLVGHVEQDRKSLERQDRPVGGREPHPVLGGHGRQRVRGHHGHAVPRRDRLGPARERVTGRRLGQCHDPRDRCPQPGLVEDDRAGQDHGAPDHVAVSDGARLVARRPAAGAPRHRRATCVRLVLPETDRLGVADRPAAEGRVDRAELVALHPPHPESHPLVHAGRRYARAPPLQCCACPVWRAVRRTVGRHGPDAP